MRGFRGVAGALAMVAAAGVAHGGDWPMHRYDAARSGASPEKLPQTLVLQWSRKLPAREAAFVPDTRNVIDDCHHPVVVGKTLLVGLEHNNCLLAIDTETGKNRWKFFADGAIRFAPACADGVAYVAADDGVLYAVDIATGTLRWRYRAAPAERRIVNHGRVSSNWPTSGGPVVKDGVVYVAAGVWPLDGTYVHAVDARTGQRVWSTGADVCWGYITLVAGRVVVPSGKYPTVVDAQRGEAMAHHYWDAKNLCPNQIVGWQETHLWSGNTVFGLDKKPTYKSYANAEHGATHWPPVLGGDKAYGINDGILRVLRQPEDAAAKRPALVEAGGPWYVNARPEYKWSQVGEALELPAGSEVPAGWYPRRAEIKAGDRLFATGPGLVVGIDLPEQGKPAVGFVAQTGAERASLAAADGKLFVASSAGTLFCYGDKAGGPAHAAPKAAEGDAARAGAIVEATGIKDGYCLVLGLKDGRLISGLAGQSKLRIVGVDRDEKKVAALRASLDGAGVLSRDCTLITAEARDLPTYMASLVVSETGLTAGDVAALPALVRPYGGTAVLESGAKVVAPSAEFKAESKGALTLLTRPGALSGATDWTHERGDVAATLCSGDAAIQPPLGLLWYGGPAAEWKRTYAMFLPPGPTVVQGKYIMQGHGLISCVDVYTGMLMWEQSVPKVQYYGAYLLDFRKGPDGKPAYPHPADKAWAAGHGGLLPGEVEVAKLSGNAINMVTMPDAIYAAIGEELWTLETSTGQVKEKRPVPALDAEKTALCWGSIRVVGDTLLATAFDPRDIRAAFPLWYQGNEKNKQRLPMPWLFAMHRGTGAVIWKRRAESGFLNWGITVGNGRVYAVDTYTHEYMKTAKGTELKLSGATPTFMALDLASGKELWKQPLDPLGIEPVYSAEHDLVVMPSRGKLAWKDGQWVGQVEAEEPTENAAAAKKPAVRSIMTAYRGTDGTKAWQVRDAHYPEPLLLNGNLVITRLAEGYDISTGKPAVRPDPITQSPQPWTVSSGGCNFLVGSEFFTTHRICYDDTRFGQTVPLRGMRSGCTPTILPANGVMSCLNYSSNYPSDELRSAYVMVHRPGNANWTNLSGARGGRQPASAGATVMKMGVNLGAPADHMSPRGVAFLRQDAPAPAKVDGRGRPVAPAHAWAKVTPVGLGTFAVPPASVSGTEEAHPWVAASGFEGIEELSLPLVRDGKPRAYTVRLHFMEPTDAKPGERVFAVAVQGREALVDFDVTREAGGARRAVARTIKGVEVGDVLSLKFTPKAGKPILSGVEVQAE